VIVPFPLGLVKVTLAEVEVNELAVPIVGGPTFVVAVTELDNADVKLLELVEVIVNVYIVFEVNPVKYTGKYIDVPYVILPERSFTL
jgi:hypothetical protein